MKVDRKTQKFEPVTITLETQEEVDAVYAIIGLVAQGGSNVRVYEFYKELEAYVSDLESPMVTVWVGIDSLKLQKGDDRG